MTELRESARKSRQGIDFRLPPHRDMIFGTVRERNNVEREHKWIVADLGWNVFTLCREQAQKKEDKAYRAAYDRNLNLYTIQDSCGYEITEEMEDCHDLKSLVWSIFRYAAKLDIGEDLEIIDRFDEENSVFSVYERDLILDYAYRMDNCEKARKLSAALAYCLEYEPVNAALIVRNAKAEIDAFPDRKIGLWEMHGYGHSGNGMLPLMKERAQVLFSRGMTVHILYKDGSKDMASDRKQIREHEGIFGVNTDDWEKERKGCSVKAEITEDCRNQELQLLYGSIDRYGIYQLRDASKLDWFRFEGTVELIRKGIASSSLDSILPKNYELVYRGELSDMEGDIPPEKLETIYEEFTNWHPTDCKGHPLSVSDIIVLHERGVNRAYYVDSFGFTELPGFTYRLQKMFELEAKRKMIEGYKEHFLPNGMVSLWGMRKYGYSGDEMLPVTKEMAIELFREAVDVYLLHPDGSETLAKNWGMLQKHNCLFGVTAYDWRVYLERDLEEYMPGNEERLLYDDEDRFGIYRLMETEGRFKAIDHHERKNFSISEENYLLIHFGKWEGGMSLSSFVADFNANSPEDFIGGSLFVSDVVVLHRGGNNMAFYINPREFIELPDFIYGIQKRLEAEAEQEMAEDGKIVLPEEKSME